MVLIRLVSLIFVALALMVLGADILFSLETETFDPRSLIDIWAAVSEGSAAGIQDWANGLPGFLSAVVNAFLHAWGFVALGIPGVLLAIVAGRR